MRTRVGVLVLGVLGTGTWVEAQNLVANAEFDRDVAGWTVGSMSLLSWGASDWQGAPSSGSANVTNAAPCASTSVYQCVTLPLPLAPSYEMGAVIIAAGTFPVPSGYVSGGSHEGPACGGLALSSFQSTTVGATGQWTAVLEDDIVLPANAQSVSISLVVNKSPFLPSCLPPLGLVFASFDHVRFGPTGTTPVTLQSLSVE